MGSCRRACPETVDLLQQFLRRRTIRGIVAAVGNENVSRAIEQEISARLINVFLAVIFARHSLTKQLKIKLQSSRGKDTEPGQSFKRERLIRLSFRIGQDRKRPSVLLLIMNQLRRFGK